jgi:hypothetical protein
MEKGYEAKKLWRLGYTGPGLIQQGTAVEMAMVSVDNAR